MFITTYIHYSAGADELASMHGNRFSPEEDFFVNPFSSVLTIMQDITMHMYMYMYIHWYRCCLKKQTHSGTVGFAPEKYMLSLSLLKITSHCNSIKVFGSGP